MKAFFIVLFLIISNCSLAQFWIQQGKGATNNMGYAIAVDDNDNTYSTGYFSGSIEFGNFTLNSTGLIDMFLVKTDPNGNVLWVKKAGGPSITQGISIAVNGNTIVVAGFFYASSTFESTTITSHGQQDVFIAKYDLNGSLHWVVNAGGSAEDAANKISVDAAGNIYLTGEFSSTNFSAGLHSLSAMNSSLDIFTAKYDANGACLWAKAGSSPYIDRGTQIAFDAAGNVYVSGEFSDTVQFDLVHNNVMFNALFLIKYDSNGSEQWFRWFGSGNTVKMKGLSLNTDGDLIVLGNFTSTLHFFGFSSPFTLSNSNLNNYFISKISTNGDLTWAVANGSNSFVSSECLTVSAGNDIVVGGTYQCRFDDFSNNYGSGVFCSIGYNDCFVSAYSTNGTWLSAQCYGGNKTDYLFGMDVDSQGKLCLAGAFHTNIYFPENYLNFIGYPNIAHNSSTSFCSDNQYHGYIDYYSFGNSDVYIGKPIDPSRQVFDYFDRNGVQCNRGFLDFCIMQCEDTVDACDQITLRSNTFTHDEYEPEFHYLWNTGDTFPDIFATTSGFYSVVISTYDGCFSDEDTIYVDIHQSPSVPPISDDKGVNNNSLNPLTVFICAPDSVMLSAVPPVGTTFEWISFPSGEDSITVNASGTYFFEVTDQFGCKSVNRIEVDVSSPLATVDPRIICVEDTDQNDTITICANSLFTVYAYDTISNPSAALNQCIPQVSYSQWSINDPSITFPTPINNCQVYNAFSNITNDGWYTVTTHFVRENTCAKDSFDLSITVYVILNPAPPDTLNISISGNTFFCPGGSTTLTAHGNANFTWSNSANGCVGTTCTYDQAGAFFLYGTRDTINQFGCIEHLTSQVNFSISSVTLPQITVSPASALICPFDSVQLTCDGTGDFSWQGPNGAINTNASSIFVTTSGFYYCIRDDGNCILNSTSVEVYQYNTPLLITLGPGTICDNQPVDIQIVTGVGSIVNWSPPLSGNSLTQTITSPGTYSCTVNTCNINTPLRITVPGSNPVANISYSALTACEGDTIHLVSDSAEHYEWLPTGETTRSIDVFSSGTYTLNIIDSLDCPASDVISVNVYTNFLQEPVTNDTIICQGESLALLATGNNVMHWMDQNNQLVSTGFSYNAGNIPEETYFILYSDSGGCRSGNDTLYVYVYPCDTITIPNVITPDGDGKNDFFPDDGGNGKLFTIIIFNRWGAKIFDSVNEIESWDGKTESGDQLTSGVYYFIVDVKFLNGKFVRKQGWLQVIN